MTAPAADLHAQDASGSGRGRGPRILLISPEPFYAVRGTPMNVLQMCRALVGAGYRVDLATYPLGKDVELENLEIHRCMAIPGIHTVPIGFSMRKVLLDCMLAMEVLWLLVRRRYALVHAIEESIFLVLPLTWLGVRVVYDLDSMISDQLEYSGAIRNRFLLSLVRSMERLALRRSHAAVTVCRSLTETVLRLDADARVFQIEDAPLEEFVREADPDRISALRRELALDGRRVIVYTGNLEAYQGIDLLLEALALLRQEVANVSLVLVGGSREELESLAPRLEELQLEESIVAVGRKPPGEMPEWMALGEVLVSPRTLGENTPLKIYTYMRSGIPIVATDLTTHTQVLDPSLAILCGPRPEALAAGLARALMDTDGSAELGRRARQEALQNYSFEAFSRKLVSAYAAILSP